MAKKTAKQRKRRAKGGGARKDDARDNNVGNFPPAPEHAVGSSGDYDVFAVGDDGLPFDPESLNLGHIEIPTEDGGVEIDFSPPKPDPKDSKFNDNLAEYLDGGELARIVDLLLPAIDQDEHDRAEWLQQRADGIDLLGQKIEKPGTGNVGTSSTAVAGQSTVRDPVLGSAVDRFQANAFAEICPSEGPCKVVNFGAEDTDSDQLAEDLEKDFNFYLTTTAKEYYPDTRKMLWWTGFASGMFKKVYWCPLRRRPVSESIDGSDLIVPSNITDLHNAGRITHQINMRHATMRRMQILGVYRDVELGLPTPQPNVLVTKTGEVVGMNPKPTRQEDQDYTVYECYCELDVAGFEHTKDGDETGLPLPYRVTIDKDSRTVLEIRRNWREEDEDFQAKIPFVPFLYGTGVGFYGAGLLQKLGNLTMACTAMLRELIDAGMFASFPGFLYAKPLGRQLQNEFRVAPGSGAPIDVSAISGGNINQAVMPLPYKEPSPALVNLWAQVREAAAQYGGMADAPVGEGVQQAPVGTTLALIEQATKIEGGVHKSLHAAQAEEFQLLKELLREDPEALWRGNRRPALGHDMQTRLQRFEKALEDCEIVPASDPNVPSHMHRLAKAASLMQMAMAAPQLFNLPALLTRCASMMKIDDFQMLLAPPQGPPPPDPIAQGMLALKAQDIQVKQAQIAANADKAQKDRQSKEQIEALKLAQSHAIAMRPAEQQQTDPLQEQALQLKKQQVMQSGQKMLLDAHNAHQDRLASQNEKAMDISARLATHPESQPVVNTELHDLSGFLTPNAANSFPMSSGGAAGPTPSPESPPQPLGEQMQQHMQPQLSPEAEEAQNSIELALRIIDRLGVHPGQSPTTAQPAVNTALPHAPRWWDAPMGGNA